MDAYKELLQLSVEWTEFKKELLNDYGGRKQGLINLEKK